MPHHHVSASSPCCSRLLYCDHVDRDGEGLFQLACERDLESIVAKWKCALYLPDKPTSWLTIRNCAYSQWIGREELFERERGGEEVLPTSAPETGVGRGAPGLISRQPRRYAARSGPGLSRARRGDAFGRQHDLLDPADNKPHRQRGEDDHQAGDREGPLKVARPLQQDSRNDRGDDAGHRSRRVHDARNRSCRVGRRNFGAGGP